MIVMVMNVVVMVTYSQRNSTQDLPAFGLAWLRGPPGWTGWIEEWSSLSRPKPLLCFLHMYSTSTHSILRCFHRVLNLFWDLNFIFTCIGGYFGTISLF